MKAQVLSKDGKKTSKSVNLPDDIFGVEPNDHAIYLAVKQYLAHQRQGTHKTKERGEVTGSTKKIKKQKGTGGARAGNIKNPLFVGGGTVFGPKPHKYSLKLNKKVKDVAKKSAFTYKAKGENSLIVVEDFTMDKPKTKDFAQILKSIGVADKKSLFLIPEKNENLVRSGRNVPVTNIGLAAGVNTYDIMKAQVLILTEGSVKKIEETFTAKS